MSASHATLMVKGKEIVHSPSMLYRFSRTHYKPVSISCTMHPLIAQASTSSTTTPHSCVSLPYMMPPNQPLSTLA